MIVAVMIIDWVCIAVYNFHTLSNCKVEALTDIAEDMDLNAVEAGKLVFFPGSVLRNCLICIDNRTGSDKVLYKN